MGCYMQQVTRTIHEKYEFGEDFSPSTSMDSAEKRELRKQ
jgi:hypothetical protein